MEHGQYRLRIKTSLLRKGEDFADPKLAPLAEECRAFLLELGVVWLINLPRQEPCIGQPVATSHRSVRDDLEDNSLSLLGPQARRRERSLELCTGSYQVCASFDLDHGASPTEPSILRDLDHKIGGVAAANSSLQIMEVQHKLLGSHSNYTVIGPTECQKVALQG